VETIVEGKPTDTDKYESKKYLLDKLSETRKDAQWLLALGAAGVLGVLIKDGFGTGTPVIRLITLIVSMVQIFVSMIGALTWGIGDIDKASVIDQLRARFRWRYWIRNVSVSLLAVSFILIAFLGWQPVLCKK
jgi:hypothetical protein